MILLCFFPVLSIFLFKVIHSPEFSTLDNNCFLCKLNPARPHQIASKEFFVDSDDDKTASFPIVYLPLILLAGGPKTPAFTLE
jgi:hypothetical protein